MREGKPGHHAPGGLAEVVEPLQLHVGPDADDDTHMRLGGCARGGSEGAGKTELFCILAASWFTLRGKVPLACVLDPAVGPLLPQNAGLRWHLNQVRAGSWSGVQSTATCSCNLDSKLHCLKHAHSKIDNTHAD